MISKEQYEELLKDTEWDYDAFNLPCPECGENEVSLCTCNAEEEDETPFTGRVGRFKCKSCHWVLPSMDYDCENCQGIEAITAAYLGALRNDDSD